MITDLHAHERIAALFSSVEQIRIQDIFREPLKNGQGFVPNDRHGYLR